MSRLFFNLNLLLFPLSKQLGKYLMHVYMVVNGNQSISKATLHQLLNKSVWRSAIFLTVSPCSLCNLTASHSTLPHTVFCSFLLFFGGNVAEIVAVLL